MKILRKSLYLLVASLTPTLLTGCNPFGMGFFTPIPVQTWMGDRLSERVENRNDHKVPVLPPITPGHRPYCEDPPGQQEILRAMPRVTRGVPYLYEEFRDDIEFTVEKLVDRIDPPRFIPLLGPAQLHHCHWKCTMYYTETIDSSYPFPVRIKRRRAEVIYIDKDHFHLVATSPDAMQEIYRSMTAVRP